MAHGVCPNNMNCIAETPCNDESYLDWLRDQQQSGNGGVQPSPSVIAAPTPPTTNVVVSPTTTSTSNNSNSKGGRCTSNNDCTSPTQFCNQPSGSNSIGYCGACLISNGIGCATEDVCRPAAGGCHTTTEEMTTETKCYKRVELNEDCEIRLNQIGARCNVDSMMCEGSGSSGGGSSSNMDTSNAVVGGVGTMPQQHQVGNTAVDTAQQQQGQPSTGNNGAVANEEAANAMNPQTSTSTTMYHNPVGNNYFCGIGYHDIISQCLDSKPCPGGKGSDWCESHEACFSAPSCTDEYEKSVVVLDGISSGGNDDEQVAPPPSPSVGNNNVPVTPQVQVPVSSTPQQEQQGTTPVNQSQQSAPVSTTSQQEAEMLTNNFCGTSWQEHLDCTRPCPIGNECGEGESCFHGSPCSVISSEVPVKNENESELEEESVVEGSTVGNENPAADQVSLPNDSSTVDVSSAGEEVGPSTNEHELPYGKGSAPNTSAETILVNVEEEAKQNDTPSAATATTEEEETEAVEQSNIPSEEACSLCGNSGQLDWSEQVTYEDSSISCGEFGWIFLSDSIAEGSDKCLNLRSKYFDKCCYTKPAGDGCALCDTGVEGTWHDIRENVNVKFNGDDVSCMDLQNKVRSRFEPESDKCLETKEEHFDNCW